MTAEELRAILITVSVVLALLSLKGFLRLYPTFLRCVSRWKEAFSLQHSLGDARDRDILAFACLLPFAVIIDKYAVYSPSFMEKVPELLRTPALILGAIALAVLRRIFGPKHRRYHREQIYASVRSMYTHFIVLTTLLIGTVLVLEAFHCSQDAIRAVSIGEIALMEMVSMVHTAQILGSFCRGFATFLYLCALEIIPTALIVVSAMVL